MFRLAVVLTVALAPWHPASAAAMDDVATIKACLAQAAGFQTTACIGRISDACRARPEGASTMGMNDCISREADAWDAILNENYRSEIASAKSIDADRRENGDAETSSAADLLKAQRAWIAYRDAECDRRFELYKDGTIRTTLAASCRLDLTARRALDLRPLL